MRSILASLVLLGCVLSVQGGAEFYNEIEALPQDFIKVAYDAFFDVGINTGYWGTPKRRPGTITLPAGSTVTTPVSESYGVNFYSEATFDIYFEFLSFYRLHYAFYFVICDFTPFAVEL